MGGEMISLGMGQQRRQRNPMQTSIDPATQAQQMLTQQAASGAGAQLQPMTPQFGPSGAPDWGQMRHRFVANGGLQRRTQY